MDLQTVTAGAEAGIAEAAALLQEETLAGFDWLAAGLDRSTPVSFLPNPGNIGDAAINLSCLAFLRRRFDAVRIVSAAEACSAEILFVGGGGNLVEGLYGDLRKALDSLARPRSVRIFPSTVFGYTSTLDRFGGRLRLLCREAASLAHLRQALPLAELRLAHDAVFASAVDMAAFARTRPLPASPLATILRTDAESIDKPAGGALDIMEHRTGAWTDPEAARQALALALRYLSGFRQIRTDRLHAAILGALLGRNVILCPNAYFKNAAVYRQSLSRLANVTFDGDPAHLPEPMR